MRLSPNKIKIIASLAAVISLALGCGHSKVVIGRAAERPAVSAASEQSQSTESKPAQKTSVTRASRLLKSETKKAEAKPKAKKAVSVLRDFKGGSIAGMDNASFKKTGEAKVQTASAAPAAPPQSAESPKTTDSPKTSDPLPAADQPQSSPARPRPEPLKEDTQPKPGPAPYKLDLSYGGFGLGVGLFDTPISIAVDDQENMYVVDQGNYRVQKFDRFGLFQFAFGRQGMGEGEFAESTTAPPALRMTGEFEFNKPVGIFLDKDDTRNLTRIHIADSLNNRIQRFLVASNVSDFMNTYSPLDASGQNVFIMLTKTGNQVDTALHDKFLAENRLVILDPVYLRDISGKANAFLLAPFVWGGLGFTQGQVNSPTYLTKDENNVLWVSDTDNGRVEGFNLSEANPATDATYFREFGNDINLPYGAGRLNQPTAIAYDNQGFGGFLVLDKLQSGGYAIEKFDREGKFTGVFTASGEKEGQLQQPVALAVNTFDNTCYVTDRGRRKVMVYNNKGEFMYEFGGEELADPRGIVVLRNGYVYVTDAAKNMVYRYVPQ